MAVDIEDKDPTETREWLEALQGVLEAEGPERAHFIIEQLIDKARRAGVWLPYKATTAYLNTIPTSRQPLFPGDIALERKIRSYIRWNAMAMVVSANRREVGLGGHIASYSSAATLYEIGFNHFFRGPDAPHGEDMIFYQGHSSPGFYARAFLEGRLTREQLINFRQESAKDGLSSYPHPTLMPDFWHFPTVSMGLGPIQSIYQARFMRYMTDRGFIDPGDRKIWTFCGDGEMDEPESLGAIRLAGRERLDNLIFVINCNLQRLDGPVHGNGKIIQEFEGIFRGAGWNVIKVVWGRHWDPLLAADKDGLLQKRMEEAVDGEYQGYKASGDGAFVREHFFGKYPELLERVAHMSDDDIWRLNRGGHDSFKVYAAYAAAVAHRGQPTVILAKTVKGYGMGIAGEGQNITHQQKKMGEDSLMVFRDRFNIPLTDAELDDVPLYLPPEDSPEMRYMHERRKALGGYIPAVHRISQPLPIPGLEAFSALLAPEGGRAFSTTMATVRALTVLLRDKHLKRRIVPIIPDEARTFGMEGMFRQLGIYSSVGQLYEPMDASAIAPYKESKDGQILEEGITEAGAMSSWMAAGTSHINHREPMIPFYLFYSMFGFQRVGDLIWAAADMQAKGFLIGGTSGRTTLAGEGLQHQDGHSLLLASTVPRCVSYDPTFAYELAVIVQDGLRRMYQDEEEVFYYITTLNENYPQPPMPEGVVEGIRKGLYLLQQSPRKEGLRVQLMGAGAILREAMAAAEILEKDYGVAADIWSAPSFVELRRDAMAVERWNRLHPEAEPKVSWVASQLAPHAGPVVAATDYMKAIPDGIRPFVDRTFVSLGTDGYGRSDTRDALRAFFEVNRFHIAWSALYALYTDGALPLAQLQKAQKTLNIDADKSDPAVS
ncbi:MAG: pyruvate dehydrogenase (acetyl-transferring), homodimeric type [Proteobacteria bacterium]|nr:pyruvate dehydrogenase (acetyl-transferring), homodimeric type [Pseudomonadota bacterium]